MLLQYLPLFPIPQRLTESVRSLQTVLEGVGGQLTTLEEDSQVKEVGMSFLICGLGWRVLV